MWARYPKDSRVTEDELDPLKPESWHGVPNVCGSCIAWRADAARDADELATGVCKLRPEIGRVPADLRKCSEYRPRGQFVYQPGKTASPKRRMAKTVSVLRQGADGTMVRSTARAEAVPASFKPVVGGYRGGPEDEAEVQSAPRTIRPAAPSTIDLGALTSTEVARYAIIELVLLLVERVALTRSCGRTMTAPGDSAGKRQHRLHRLGQRASDPRVR
jgi:hypothetical protein